PKRSGRKPARSGWPRPSNGSPKASAAIGSIRIADPREWFSATPERTSEGHVVPLRFRHGWRERPALRQAELRMFLAIAGLDVAIGRDEDRPVAAVVAQRDPHRHAAIILLMRRRLDPGAAPPAVADGAHDAEP